MSIRLTGLSSGLDTDSIVSELVSAYSYKMQDYEKEKTKLEWTEDAWEDLNTDIYSYFTSQLGTMRYQSAYVMQSTTVSDSTKATVSSSGSAVNGTQTLNIYSLAAAGYLTGGKIDTASDSTTLSSLGFTGSGTIGVTIGGTTTSISVTGDTTIASLVKSLDAIDGISASFDSTNQRIFVNSDDTGEDNDFSLTGLDSNGLKALKAAGLYAESDANSDYYEEWLDSEWTATTSTGIDEATTEANLTTILTTVVNNLKTIADDNTTVSNYNNEITYAQGAVKYLNAKTSKETAESNLTSLLSDSAVTEETGMTADEMLSALEDYYSASSDDDDYESKKTTAESIIAAVKSTLPESSDDSDTITQDTVDTYTASLKSALSTMSANEAAYTSLTSSSYYEAFENELSAAGTTYDSDAEKIAAYETYAENIISSAESDISDLEEANSAYSLLTDQVSLTADSTDEDISSAATSLVSIIEQMYTASQDTSYSSGAVKQDGANLKIVLNGAAFESSSNTITVNGLTIQAKGVTDAVEDAEDVSASNAITLTTDADSQGIYDKIKSFFSEYNTLINNLTKLYNADSASDYEPLTDDEKDEMSDTEIEKWETKIKDALLRRDDTLSGIISAFTTSLAKSVYIKDGKAITYNSTLKAYTLDGANALTDSNGTKITTSAQLATYATENGYKAYSLSSFGISTLGVLYAADDEENAYHIDGDSDDSSTSANTDKLLTAINTDPETVKVFFAALISDTYTAINNKMGSSTISSAYTIYNDKEMDDEMDDIEDQIEKWQDKLTDLEDYWYSKFSTMETALAELQSQQSALSSLLGS